MLTFNWTKMVNLWSCGVELWVFDNKQRSKSGSASREKECFRVGSNFFIFLFYRSTIPTFMISWWRALTPRGRLCRPMRRMPRIGPRASSTPRRRRRGREEGRKSSPASSVNSWSLRQVSRKENKRMWRQPVVHKSGSCTAISSRVIPEINPPELVTKWHSVSLQLSSCAVCG